MILALSVLQTEMSYFDARDELELRHRVDLVQLSEDLARVGGESHQHGQVRQGHQGHVVLRVGPGLGVGDQIDSILKERGSSKCGEIWDITDLLCLQSGGMKISIPHKLRVVHTDDRALQNHRVIIF